MENFAELKKEVQLLQKQNRRLLLGLNVVAVGLIFQTLLNYL